MLYSFPKETLFFSLIQSGDISSVALFQNSTRYFMHRIISSVTVAILFVVSLQAQQQLSIDSLAKPLRWRNIGPANQGGRIVDIESLDNDYRKVWAATGSGGVWYSENAGTTWTPIFDHYETASIGDIAVFQADPKIIWVGTGESNNRNSLSWGNGVYRSTDGGKTFTNVGLQNTHHIGRVVLHPQNPDIAYVAALGHLWGINEERGLYMTTDGGKSWKLLKGGLPESGKEGCTDVVMHPSDPKTLYAAYYYRLRKPYHFHSGSNNGGIFKTTDGGQTWKKLTTGLPADSTGRIGLAVCKTQPGILMAIVEAPKTDILARPGSGIYRSEDGGESWKYVNTYNNRPFYYSQIRIHPTDAQKVYVLTTPFMVSNDGGKKFVNGSPDDEIHGDFHAMWIDPVTPDRYYIGADKGLSLTHDGGRKFILFDNLPIAQYYRIAYDMNTPYRIYGGLQDNGFYATESFARDARGILNDVNWKVHWGDGQYAAVNPGNSKDVYTSSENGSVFRLDPSTHQLKNISPASSTIINARALIRKGSSQPLFRYNWSAPFLLSPHDHKTLFIGAQYVLKSIDGGKTWKMISPDLSSGDSNKIKTGSSGGITPDNTGAEIHGTVYTLSQSPVDAGMIWAGTDDGGLHLTVDDGKVWRHVNNTWPSDMKDLWIDRVVASSHKKARAYVTVDGHTSNIFRPFIMVTEDAGQSWRSISNNIPSTEVIRSFAEDVSNENLLFAGTETGVWFSIDRGQQWSRLNRNLPVVSVYDLKIHPREKDLIAATHGRSLWIMDDIGYLQQFTPEVQKSKAWLFNHKPIVLWENTSRGGQRGHFLFAGENPPGIINTSSKPRAATSQAALITFYVGDTSAGKVQIIISDPVKGHKRTVDTTVAPGVHRITWNLNFDAPLISKEEIEIIDSLVMSMPEVESASRTALQRLKSASASAEQRQLVERLVNANPGIAIPEKLLPVKAVPGLYAIKLQAGTVVQQTSLKVNDDPLNEQSAISRQK